MDIPPPKRITCEAQKSRLISFPRFGKKRETKVERSEDVVVKDGFLDLPGEIRNMIYDYALQIDKDEGHAIEIIHHSRRQWTRSCLNLSRGLSNTGKPYYKSSWGFKNVDSPCYSLSRVCRLVRSEYLPFYLWHGKIQIDIYDVGSFVSFIRRVVEQQGTTVVGALTAHLTINVTNIRGVDVDLLPLFKLAAEAPQFTFDFSLGSLNGLSTLGIHCLNVRLGDSRASWFSGSVDLTRLMPGTHQIGFRQQRRRLRKHNSSKKGQITITVPSQLESGMVMTEFFIYRYH